MSFRVSATAKPADLQVKGEPVGEVKRRTIVSERANEVVGAGAVSSEEREREGRGGPANKLSPELKAKLSIVSFLFSSA